MPHFTKIAMAACIILLAACAPTPTPQIIGRPFDPADVKLPATTPFDNDVAMRAVYLNHYWFGYAEALRGVGSSFCDNGHPWYLVQLQGFGDGQRDGFKEAFEKQRRISD